MNSKLSITYRDMNSSQSIDYLVSEQLEKVERHWPSLQSCKVVIAAPTAKQTTGGHFQVSVDLLAPDAEAFADRDPSQSYVNEDCQAAVRDAFRAALKELNRDRDRRHKLRRHPRDMHP